MERFSGVLFELNLVRMESPFSPQILLVNNWDI